MRKTREGEKEGEKEIELGGGGEEEGREKWKDMKEISMVNIEDKLCNSAMSESEMCE